MVASARSWIGWMFGYSDPRMPNMPRARKDWIIAKYGRKKRGGW
jgi:hypothetical protein